MTVTFYDVLDVAPDATAEEIQTAYREKVKEHHPDVSDHPKAEARFRAVVRAEEVLGEPDERARYDRLGHEAYLRVTSKPGESTDPTDAVDDSRGRGRPSGRSRERSRPGSRSEERSHPGRSEDGSWTWSGDQQSDSDQESGSGQQSGGDRASGGTGGRGNSAGRSGGGPTDRGSWADEEWWREAWAPGSGEDNWRQATDPNQRSYTPGDGGTAATGQASRVAAEVERERKRRQAASRQDDDSFWSAEVDAPVDQVRRDRSIARKIRSGDTAMLSMALMIIYPVFVYFSVAPTAPVITIAAILGTAAVAVVSLVEPAVSLIVFGSWSLMSPLVLTFLGHSLLSLTGMAVLAAFWVPLVITVLVAIVLVQ